MKKVFIDLDLLDRLEEEKDLGIECSYPYHPQNEGVTTLRELASYAVICRKCEEASCVLSCPKEALEKDDEGVLRRYNMRCISCKSCAVACPFGTIYPLAIPYTVSRCDFCIDRLKPGEEVKVRLGIPAPPTPYIMLTVATSLMAWKKLPPNKG